MTYIDMPYQTIKEVLILENITLAFTIILSFVGLAISIGSLVLAIIYIIRLSKIDQMQSKLQIDIEGLNKLKNTLIIDCGCIYPMYSGTDRIEFKIQGRSLIDWFKQVNNIEDDLDAVNIFKAQDEHKIIEEYIKNHYSHLEKINTDE